MSSALRISTALPLLSLLTTLAASAGVAHAVPMHMDVKVKARAAAKGRVCGATITCKVRSDNNGFGRVRVGLAPIETMKGIDSSSQGRVKAWDMSHGIIKVQGPTLTGLAVNTVHDVTIEVDYDGKTFAPGKRFQVVSGWASNANEASVHVFGAATTFGKENEIGLP